MKTIVYLTLILILAFQGIVMGQEKSNPSQPLKPTIKHNEEGVKKEPKKIPAISAQVSNQEKRIQLIDKQIVELKKLKASDSNISELEVVSIETTNFKTKNSQSLIKEVNDYFDLQIESKLLVKTYLELIDESKLEKNYLKKEKLVETAIAVFEAFEVKQIDISNVFGRINQVKFEENKATIRLLLFDYKGGLVYEDIARKLSNEADFAMRMATEIREEANRQPSSAAVLGSYSNAEEKEIVALTKQNKAIEILEKTAFILFTNWTEGLAYTELKR
jgi:hypothetical protein